MEEWSHESMRQAIEGVSDGKMDANLAARTSNMPSWKDRLSGRVKNGKPGPHPPYIGREKKCKR